MRRIVLPLLGHWQSLGCTLERNENWQDYVNMFADALEEDDELIVIPIFSNAGFTKGNVMVVSACAARAVAGVGTPEDIQRSRRHLMAKRIEIRQ